MGLFATLAVLGAPALAAAASCPNVHIVLDRSGSMSSLMSGGGTRWSTATQIVNKLVGLADPLRAAKIGLALFPKASCDSLLAVRPDYSTKAMIAAALAAAMPSGSTPSGTAIRDAATLTELKDATRKQYIILLTDGGPGCGGEPDTVTGTVNQITLARTASPSIGTYVVGVGDGLSSSEQLALGQMADAGGYPEATMARYYKGTTALELESSLTKIMIAIQTANAGCVDATPADMAMPADLGVPADMRMSADLAGPPTDLAMTPADLAMTPTDLAMTPMDLAMTPADLAMTPADLAMNPADLAMTPADLAMTPVDLAMTPVDLATVGDGGSGRRPLVVSIAPPELEQGKSGPAIIQGSGFVSAAPSSSVYLEGQSRLVALTNVLVEDDQTIKVFVPGDLPVGVYDVVVKNPDGAIGRLSGGFTVTATTASGCSCNVGGHAPPAASPLAILFGLGLLALLRVRTTTRRRAPAKTEPTSCPR
ncbi:MAG: VWA domain-containing protein [Myxococcales bacterium]|nr:VWA domain-containing protein [Myxococcales bacterium]